ncbi:Arm DNA-binding domain-containing protein [Bacillus cereus]|uniref:Arm DNA-binding domain-containing protein n=1 Tax=Bacillus cereus TaxID=1396 RepID=UPI003F85F855
MRNTELSVLIKITIYSTVKDSKEALNDERKRQKDKRTGKYFYIVDIGIDPFTVKRKQKRKRGFITKKRSGKCFNKVAIRSSHRNICKTT